MQDAMPWIVTIGAGFTSLVVVVSVLLTRRGGTRVGALPVFLAASVLAPLAAAVAEMPSMEGVAILGSTADFGGLCVGLRLRSLVAWMIVCGNLVLTVEGLALAARAAPAGDREAGSLRVAGLGVLSVLAVAVPFPVLFLHSRAVE